MQSIMFLRSTDDGPIDRIINLDRLSTAHPNPDGTGTIVIVAGAEVRMGMPFAEFLKHVEYMISENYRISNETSIAWHKKRIDDQAEMMKTVMKEFHQ